jgi:hypothetical protein
MKTDVVMATIQPSLWLTVFCCPFMSSSSLIKGWLDTCSTAHRLLSLLPLNPVELRWQPTSPQPHQISMTACPHNLCLITLLVLLTKCATSYFTFIPGHKRDNREAKMFSSAVKGSRDKKLGECVARYYVVYYPIFYLYFFVPLAYFCLLMGLDYVLYFVCLWVLKSCKKTHSWHVQKLYCLCSLK